MTQSLRIVIADDEPDMRDYFQQVLPRLGHAVVGIARNGCELVELCRSAHPDLVITDLRMPELDGIDATRQICQNGPIPVILVSAYHGATVADRAETSHIMSYLGKPIKLNDLASAIRQAMYRFEQFRS